MDVILEFLDKFGAYGFGFAILLWNIRTKQEEIENLKQEIKEERKNHDLYVDRVSDTLIIVNQKLK
jgi:hypothetical protein